MSNSIYLDYNATTPVDPRVVKKMSPYFSEFYGNPSSAAHMFGWTANAAIEEARFKVAECLGIDTPSDITFNSGATEGINTAIKGFADANSHRGNHLITVETEHSAVLHSCKYLEHKGWHITYLPVDHQGVIDLNDLEDSLTDQTILACVMWANNETGILQQIPEIASLVRSKGIALMTDATQAVGKIPISVEDVDILVCSSHKVYGPKGVGAMYVRRRLKVNPLIAGGGQERGQRSGTHNVSAIVGMGEAFRLAHQECDDDSKRLSEFRHQIESSLKQASSEIQIHGQEVERLPQTSSVSFPRLNLERLLLSLRTLAVGTGSACGTGNYQPSHVLSAMGIHPDDAKQTLRISLGRPTTQQQVDQAIEILTSSIQELYQKAA
ncbi:MAG: cysteine desulfurase family protein [Bacteroidetes bacterium]|nr:cysteine desulfurase family protein [Bacteroidota bacterium]